MRQRTIESIERCKIIALVQEVKGERIVPMAKALLEGSIDCIEVLFDPTGDQSEQDVAAQISMLTSYFEDTLCIGAGNVTNRSTLNLAVKAGAQFISATSSNAEIIKATREADLVSIAGAFTPTEIMNAYRMGADIVNLFPASFFGTEYLEQIRYPLGNITLMAEGGISVWNMRAFIDAGCSCVGIGPGLIGEVYAKDCDYGIIAETAKAYNAIVTNDRKPRNRDL